MSEKRTPMADAGKKLTKAQLKALLAIHRKGRASPYEVKASIATFMALESRKLIVVETTLGSIAFPRNAQATLTEAGRSALNAGANHDDR